MKKGYFNDGLSWQEANDKCEMQRAEFEAFISAITYELSNATNKQELIDMLKWAIRKTENCESIN